MGGGGWGAGGRDTINYKTLIPKERMPKDSVKNHFLKDQNSQEILQITKIFQKRINVFTPFHDTYKIHLGNIAVVLAIKFHSKVKFDSYEVVEVIVCFI